MHELLGEFHYHLGARVHVHQVLDGGRARPLNVGLQRAAGRYVAFLDDDDLVTADWVEVFRRGALAKPGRVVRSVCVQQDVSSRPRRRPRLRGPLGLPQPLRADVRLRPPPGDEPDPDPHVRRPAPDARRAGDPLRRVPAGARGLGLPAPGRSGRPAWSTPREVTAVYHWWVERSAGDGAAPPQVWHGIRDLLLQRLTSRPLLLPPEATRQLVGWAEENLANRRVLEEAEAHHRVDHRQPGRVRAVARLAGDPTAALRPGRRPAGDPGRPRPPPRPRRPPADPPRRRPDLSLSSRFRRSSKGRGARAPQAAGGLPITVAGSGRRGDRPMADPEEGRADGAEASAGALASLCAGLGIGDAAGAAGDRRARQRARPRNPSTPAPAPSAGPALDHPMQGDERAGHDRAGAGREPPPRSPDDLGAASVRAGEVALAARPPRGSSRSSRWASPGSPASRAAARDGCGCTDRAAGRSGRSWPVRRSRGLGATTRDERRCADCGPYDVGAHLGP